MNMLTKSQKRNLRRSRLRKEKKQFKYPFVPYIDGRNDHPFLSDVCSGAKESCSPKCVECGYQEPCFWCESGHHCLKYEVDESGNGNFVKPLETEPQKDSRLSTYADWLQSHPIMIRTTYDHNTKKVVQTQILDKDKNGINSSVRVIGKDDLKYGKDKYYKEGDHIIYFGYESRYDDEFYLIKDGLMFDWPIYLANKDDDTAGMICDLCCEAYIKTGKMVLLYSH